MKNSKNSNWLNGTKNNPLRVLSVGVPTIIGAYLGWKHGSEFSDYANTLTENKDILYAHLATTVPLLVKSAGAYLEGLLYRGTGKIATGIIEKLSESISYRTKNTTYLGDCFNPSNNYALYGTLGKLQYEKCIESFILDARKKGHFSAIHINLAKKKMGGYLDDMLRFDYLTEDSHLGMRVISPSYNSLKLMYGADKNHKLINSPFGLVQSNIKENT